MGIIVLPYAACAVPCLHHIFLMLDVPLLMEWPATPKCIH